MTLTAPWTTRTMGFGINASGHSPTTAIADLVQPGLRRNPRRAHLLVSPVLGKHIPAEPAIVIGAAEQLGAAVAQVAGGEADVLGMAETATGLGHCVAAYLRAPVYIHTTRRDTPIVASYVEFEEGHSHATHHSVRPTTAGLLDNGRPLILVDDETSTGATTLNAICELHKRRPRAHYILASLVDVRTDAHLSTASEFADRLGVRIDATSLVTGEVVLPVDLIDAVQALPPYPLNPRGHRVGEHRRLEFDWPAAVPDGGRHGFLRDDAAPFQVAVDSLAQWLYGYLDPHRPTLVIGHEELMYLPLQIAERLTAQGLSVRYQSTTRSPAYVLDVEGYPLRRGYQFLPSEPDESGPRFLYNGWPCDEAGSESQYVFVVDGPAASARLSAPGGIEDVLTAAGHDLLTVVVDGADAAALTAARADQ